jgi:hypothetical protein
MIGFSQNRVTSAPGDMGDFLSMDIKQALYLGEITGEVTTDSKIIGKQDHW